MCSLPDMPDIPMDLILEYVGFPAILVLRKVSPSFRNYIEEKKVECNFKAIDISVEYDEIKVSWISNSECMEVCYSHHNDGYEVIGGFKKKVSAHCNYIEAFFNDFKLTMAHEKSALRRFQLDLRSTVKVHNSAEFLKKFEESLKEMPIKTKYLDLGINKGNEVISILPCLDAKFLKEILLFSSNLAEKKVCLDDVVKLDQWKNAKKLSTRNLTISAQMQHFTHFSMINVEFKPIYAEDLDVLRKAAMISPNFEMFHVEYHDFNDNRRLAELFGIPFRNTAGSNHKKQWFFTTCNSGKVLEIVQWPSFDRINFSLIGLNSVPLGAEIRS